MLTQKQLEQGEYAYIMAQWEIMECLNETEPYLQFGWIDQRFVFLMQDNKTEEI